MYKLFMAFRYLRAHKIIYFSVAGVALGIMVLVVVTSIMGGFSRDMRARIKGMQSHIVVTPIDKSRWFPDYEDLCEKISAVPGVTGCAPRVEWDAWLGSGGIRRDVHFVAVVPKLERKVSDLETYFANGGKGTFDFKASGIRARELPGLVAGQAVRGSSGVVNLMTARDGGPTPVFATRDFEVVGHFASGMAEYDSTYVFLDFYDAWRFLHLKRPSANVIAVAVEDYENRGGEIRTAIMEVLHARSPCAWPERHARGQCGRYVASTWEHVKYNLLQAVEVEKGIMMIILFLIVVVACFNISAIYTLVIRAKTKDIGILRGLGATQTGIVTTFLISGGLCGLIGSFLGVFSGLLFSYNVNEIEAVITVTSRELNAIGYADLAPQASRGGLWLVSIVLAAAAASVIWSWLRFYKVRTPFPWVRVIVTLLALGTAAWLSASWDREFAWRLVAWSCGLWVVFVALWKFLARWRIRPSWIFFGFAGSFVLAGFLLSVATMLTISVAVLATNPSSWWPGLKLFPDTIYFLKDIPVCVDYTGITVIVALSLLVSLIFSIYPALRAATCDPIEAIRHG